MATIYNKTALKKVKKDELIQMFLDLQAQRINDIMEIENLTEFIQNMDKRKVGILCKKLKEENEAFKEQIDDWHKALNEPVEGLEHLQSGINLHFWQRCSGPWDADIEKINQK